MLSVIDTRPHPSAPAAFNLAAHVLGRAAKLGDKPALILLHPERDETITYARLRALVLGCATHLLAQGLRPGDRVLIRLGNGPAFPILYLGAIAADLVPVPTSAALTTAEVTKLAALVAPRLILADPGIALPKGDTPIMAPDLPLWESLPPHDPTPGDLPGGGHGQQREASRHPCRPPLVLAPPCDGFFSRSQIQP